MDTQERKKVKVITEYALESFDAGDWHLFGQLTGDLDTIQNHPRLIRSLDFGDEDYPYCVAEVLNNIFEHSPDAIDNVIDYYDVDVWYEQKDPRKYSKIFLGVTARPPEFWKEGLLKAFISHLSQSAKKVSQLKDYLSQWGISAFIAHQDIEPSKEWQREIEAALETMDVLIPIVEPGFQESDWCCQEVGYALGRKVDVIPLRVGYDPFGLMGKFQGIQAKSKNPYALAEELANLFFRKNKYKSKLLVGITKALASAQSDRRFQQLRTLNSWNTISDEQMRGILEQISLSSNEKFELSDIIDKVGAFRGHEEVVAEPDIPF